VYHPAGTLAHPVGCPSPAGASQQREMKRLLAWQGMEIYWCSQEIADAKINAQQWEQLSTRLPLPGATNCQPIPGGTIVWTQTGCW